MIRTASSLRLKRKTWGRILLAAGAQVENNRIQHPPPIFSLAASPRGWIESFEQRFNPRLEVIWNFPQGRQ